MEQITGIAKNRIPKDPEVIRRGSVVVRSNMLINGRFCASLEETKLMILSMYRAQQTGSLEVRFMAKELRGYLKASNTDRLYTSLKDMAVNITGHHIVVESPSKKKFEAFAIVTNCIYEDGIFTIKFNDSMKKYLFDLTSSYTSTEISILMSFGIGRGGGSKGKANYALRLYDILRAQKYRIGGRRREAAESFNFEQLKITLGLIDIDNTVVRRSVFDSVTKGTSVPGKTGRQKYARWDNFKRRVLEPAVEEINEKTDIRIRYELEYIGSAGKVGRIVFFISESDAYKKNIPTEHLIEEAASVIREPLGKEVLRRLVIAADGDTEKIRKAYRIACSQKRDIEDLGSWMLAAIREGWEENGSPVKKKGTKAGQKAAVRPKQRNRFCDFEQNTYDFEQLEKELTLNI